MEEAGSEMQVVEKTTVIGDSNKTNISSGALDPDCDADIVIADVGVLELNHEAKKIQIKPEAVEHKNSKEDINGQSIEEEETQFDLLDNVCNNSDNTAGDFITKEMIEEEEELHKESEIEEQIMKKEVLRQQNELEKEQCFKRLVHLLNRSKFFAEFLLKKMQSQEEEEKIKKQQYTKNISNQKAQPLTQLNKSHQGRRRKRNESNENISELPLNSGGNISHHNRERKKKIEIRLVDCVKKEDILKSQNLQSGIMETPASTNNSSVTVIDSSQINRHPALFVGTMRDYQLDGFEWLKMLYENGINGILADEMGLGKTIQCIALVAHLVEMGVPGPFLVSAPLSTLSNWISEFVRFAPQVPVILYHGNQIERSVIREKIRKKQLVNGKPTSPVVITSFGITMKDRKYLENFEWRYIILDEGHRIKNHRCRLTRELKEYHSVNRLLLTGTPLQNNLAELWSLLNFLLPEIFDDLKVFELWFDVEDLTAEEGNKQIIAQEQQKHIVSKLHEILTPFLLRRTKNDVAIHLPPKKELLVYAPLTSLQETFYKATLNKTAHELIESRQGKKKYFTPEIITGKRKRRRVSYEDYYSDNKFFSTAHVEPEENKVTSPIKETTPFKAETSVKLTNIVMQLRKVCNHPYLMEYPLDPVTENYLITEDLVKCCGKMMVLDCLVQALKKRKHKILLFSQMVKMLDILQDYCNLRLFKFCRLDGQMKLEERQEEIKSFNEDPEVFIFLLSTRAGGLGINLTAADTVIIYDSDWNPQSDLQAQDRCHRIGQTKPVVVYRLVTSDSFDQRIIERAAAKRKLEKMIMQKGKFSTGCPISNHDRITPEELTKLLKSTEYKSIIKSRNENIFTASELEMLLDRSDLTAPKVNGLKTEIPNEMKGVYKVIDFENTLAINTDSYQNLL